MMYILLVGILSSSCSSSKADLEGAIHQNFKKGLYKFPLLDDFADAKAFSTN